MKKQVPIKNYLNASRKIGVKSNFYLSQTYLELIGATCHFDNRMLFIRDEVVILFPPIKNGKFCCSPLNKIWSDLGANVTGYAYQFLDYEYIFDPLDFDNMEGGEWKVFRKNVRKWPRANPDWKYVWKHELKDYQLCTVFSLIRGWLISKITDCQDADLLADVAHFSDLSGIQRKYLLYEDKVVGINAWDENWEYINYRVCMVDKSQLYLDEFMRYIFYTDLDIRAKGKWVNDGGVLDNPKLEKFKDKLNPLIKKKIYSLVKK